MPRLLSEFSNFYLLHKFKHFAKLCVLSGSNNNTSSVTFETLLLGMYGSEHNKERQYGDIPFRTKVPINPMLSRSDKASSAKLLAVIASQCLRLGLVSPVKFDSSISRSTAYRLSHKDYQPHYFKHLFVSS